MKRLWLVVLCTGVTVPATAFDTDRAMQTISALASDRFEGRRSGFQGGRRTEGFLAAELAAAGILPAGWDSTYFQEVPMLVTREDDAALTLMDSPFGKVRFTYGDDFTLVTHSGSGAFMASAVLVGYGIDRPDKGRSDYRDLDVRGRAVVIVRKRLQDQVWDFSLDHPRERLVRWALERGAAAVLFYQKSLPLHGAAIPGEVYHAQVPMFYVGDRVLRLLFRDTGYTPDTYLTSLADGPNPLDLRKRLWIAARVPKVPAGSARNVLGFVYGTDSELRGEIVAIGAHWDHIGPNGRGLIYNGADDNASGCAVVLELTRTIAEDPASPKRSLLVLFFTGEEDGLLGSRWFVAHPTVPMGRIVAMLNFDMVGQGNGTVGMAGGELLDPAWERYRDRLASEEIENLRLYRASTSWASDATPFLQAGIPAISFWSSGEHPFYHQYEDDVVHISREVIQNVGERAEDFLRYLIYECPPLLGLSDSLRILVRLSPRIDWEGMDIWEALAHPQALAAGVQLVWLPPQHFVPTWTLIEAMERLRRTCEAEEISCGKLPSAMRAYRRQQPAVVFGIRAQALLGRSREEVGVLFRQGIGLIDLGRMPGLQYDLDEATVSAANDAGIFALMPIDYRTPERIWQWQRQAIVRATLREFSHLPAEVRDSLAASPATLILGGSADVEARDIDVIRPYVERTVCLDLGSLLQTAGEEGACQMVSHLYESGLSWDEIVLLLRQNLLRLIH